MKWQNSEDLDSVITIFIPYAKKKFVGNLLWLTIYYRKLQKLWGFLLGLVR